MTVAHNQFPNVPGETPEFTLSGIDPADFPSEDIDSTPTSRTTTECSL